MTKNPKKIMAIVLPIFFICFVGVANTLFSTPVLQGLAFDRYHRPAEINTEWHNLAKRNASFVALHLLARSAGGQELSVLEIGPEVTKRKKLLPAILVVANMDGTTPIASEAAIFLARQLIDQPETRKNKTWYILPIGNPDSAEHFFSQPLHMSPLNRTPRNDDMDDQTDEDGVEDLDKNGIITMMRVKDPEGQWLPLQGEPRLMKKADPLKGEKGIYKLYTEGIDNDGDGQYNEDGPGGVNCGINFPHLFKHYTSEGGDWPGSEEETFNLFKFVYQHPEIAMTMTFGNTNFCMTPPKGGRKGAGDYSNIKIPEATAKRFGFDSSRTYSMKEIMDKISPRVPPTVELTEGMVAGFLGLGQAVNPQKEDLNYYNVISKEYKEYLKTAKSDAKRLEPVPAKDGSFELWSYYQLGVHTFSLDFWSLPQVEKEKKEKAITPEKLADMTNEEFLALGEEKIAAFLKDSGAPDNINAQTVINMLKGGMMTTKKMAEMMKQMTKPKNSEGADPKENALIAFSDSQLKGKGFIPWNPFTHPTLGQVEIGGAVPFTDNTPPPQMLEQLLKGQMPWVLELVKKLPRIKIAKTSVKALGSGVYRVEAWVENNGFLPYPTAMGKRNKRIPPVVVSINNENIKILEGTRRSLIDAIDGHAIKKVQWLILAQKPVTLSLIAQTPNAWTDTAQVAVGK